MNTWWDVKRPAKKNLARYQMRRWLSQVPHGGIVGNVAYLIVYNREAPELSYLTFEVIE